MSLHIVILAAGRGKRMHSSTPKVLHPLAGKPMLAHVVETALTLNPAAIHVIIGHGHEQIKKSLSTLPVHWVLQDKQAGTGHAVLQAIPHIPEASRVLILYADVPLIQADTLKKLINTNQDDISINLLVATVPEPQGLGRIVRNQAGYVHAIIEEKDASDTQRQIKEIYSGICCTHARTLQRWLPQLSPKNAQGEYYLTDIIAMAVKEQLPISAIETMNVWEVQGVNDRYQLQQLERYYQALTAKQWMLRGVTIADAARIDFRGELHCDSDVFIDINTIFIGHINIKSGVRIGAHCQLTNVTIGMNSEIMPHSILEDCIIGDNCQIGPFARVRPGTVIEAHCKIGNFVEAKNVKLGRGSKANHLSYLGDAIIGQDVNIGAGTITCNYDGANKHQTIIEDGVFIGSDTQLVAPITVGKNATIGAGSTLRKNAPPNELTLTESTQKTIKGWCRPKKITAIT